MGAKIKFFVQSDLKTRRMHRNFRCSAQYLTLLPTKVNRSYNFIKLVATNYGIVTDVELKAFHRCFLRTRLLKGILYVRRIPFIPVTKKPAEVRMGKGKGTKISKYMFRVSPGTVLAELRFGSNSSFEATAYSHGKVQLGKAANRFRVSTKVVHSDIID